MNTNKKAAAVFAVIAAVSGLGGFAWAEQKTLDFDGSRSGSFFSAADLKEELSAKPVEAPEPAASEDKKGAVALKIKTLIKRNGEIKEESLTCRPGRGEDKIADCKKSDFTSLSYEDVNTLALRQYFAPETLKFADLQNQNKHSYTNQSGPMTFECHDTCANHDLVSIGFSTSFPFLEEFEVRCVEWSHECECTAGC